MASKNLGTVIQRAISDGAFRRQLQSDPAAALRGFNLTPDEVAAIRSGDSSKLMSLGVDQRMSKAFIANGGAIIHTTTSDLSAGGIASTIAADNTAGTREGIVGDPASTSRAINDADPFDSRGGLVDPTVSGTRAIHDDAPMEFRAALTIGSLSGTRAINDSEPFDSRGSVSDATVSGVRAVNDVAPFGTTGTSALEDPNSPEFAATQHAGDPVSARAVNDVAPFGTTGTSAVEDANSPESVASRMAGTDDAISVRPINDVAPFEGNVNAAAADTGAMLGDARLDPGIDSSHADITTTNTGETGNEHGWG
jgi:hypothetical protein